MEVPYFTRSLTKKIVNQGLLRWAIHEYLDKYFWKLNKNRPGYHSCEVTISSSGTRILIRAVNPQMIIGRRKRGLLRLKQILKETFNLPEPITIEVEQIKQPWVVGKYVAERLAQGIPRVRNLRRFVNAIISQIVEEVKPLGIEVRIKGKLRKRRAAKMRFAAGVILHSGEPAEKYVSHGKARAELRAGTVGVQVKIVYVPPGSKMPDEIRIRKPNEMGPDGKPVAQKLKEWLDEIDEKIRETLRTLAVSSSEES